MIMKKITIKPTILFIDNAEYLDQISWLLLHDISKLKNLVTIMGFGTKYDMSPIASKVLSKRNVITFKVSKISNDYILGVACQILNVDAIPYDLLTKLQNESDGNPGWIEGYLLICIQTGYLYFKEFKSDVVFQEQLVRPPKYMMERGHNVYLNKSVTCLGGNVQDFETETVKACVKGNFDNDNNIISVADRESTLINSYDAFTPIVKEVLKCCAVLGDIFPRQALEYLLQDMDQNLICHSIAILYEKMILGCSTKTHSYDPEYTFIGRRRLTNLFMENTVECVCPSTVDAEHRVHPTYAYCKFLRFLSKDLKLAINASLLHAEKREYHLRIIHFLHSLDTECKSCKRQNSKWKHGGVPNVFHSNELVKQDVDIPGKTLLGNLQWASKTGNLTRLRSGPCATFILHNSFTKLSDCHCHLIRLKLNEQIVYHCLEGEFLETALNLNMDCALLYLMFSDITLTLNLVERATRLLNKLQRFIKNQYAWKVPCVRSYLYMITGLCRYQLEQLNDSIGFYIQALSNINFAFPKNNFLLRLHTLGQNIKMKFRTTHRRYEIGRRKCKKNVEDRVMVTIKAEILAHMARCYIDLSQWNHAMFAALSAFNKSFKLGDNYLLMTLSLSNVIHLSPMLFSDNYYESLRDFANKLAYISSKSATFMEMKGVLHLFKSIICASELKGEFEHAIEYSHITLGISLPVQEFENKLRIIPKMIMYYTLQLEIKLAVNKLVEYESIMNTDVDNSSRIWYLALIMFILLYCGIELMPFQEITSIFEKGGKITVVKEKESERFLTCCMWLYALRHKEWKLARLWTPTFVKNEMVKGQNATVINVITLEGLLLQNSCIDVISRHLDLVERIKSLQTVLNDTIDYNLMWKPKYYHLLAYRHRLEYIKPLSKKYLNKAEAIADEQGNKLELFSVRCDRETWSNVHKEHHLHPIEPISWKGNLIDQVSFYSLPIDDHFN